MENDQTQRLRALWKSARDKYRSFFTVLNEVRVEIGDAALPDWCLTELQIGLSVITKVATTLNDTDEALVRAEFAEAKRLEREKRAAELLAARVIREQRELERERQRAEHETRIAELKAQRAEAIAGRKKTEDRETRRRNKASNPNERGPIASAKSAKRRIVANVENVELEELVKRWHTADKLDGQSAAIWIEATVAKAIVLCTARDKFPADQEFGVWLITNKIDLERDSRSALINLGRLGEQRLRETLEGTPEATRSYQLLWRKHRPSLQVVDTA